MKIASVCVGSALLVAALASVGCGAEENAETPTSSTTAALGSSCVLGDGYVIPHNGRLTIYPVTCPSDCNDFPNGGLDYQIFCVNGVLGEWDPLLTGGNVGPALNPLIWNGYSRCTAKPNPYRTPYWGQSANRKTCVPCPGGVPCGWYEPGEP